MPETSELVVVAGHAVFIGSQPPDVLDDSQWLLEDYQRGEPKHFVEHIRLGVELAANRPASCLLFSGGRTRKETPRSEAEGYQAIAVLQRFWEFDSVRSRSEIEDYARDSFENLLFGLCRFRELTGRYPARVFVVSWEFKRQRFLMHCNALGYPVSQFTFVGTGRPEDLATAERGEARVRRLFSQDPMGRRSALAAMRERRNPHRVSPPYRQTNPELEQLFSQTGSDQPIAKSTPWYRQD